MILAPLRDEKYYVVRLLAGFPAETFEMGQVPAHRVKPSYQGQKSNGKNGEELVILARRPAMGHTRRPITIWEGEDGMPRIPDLGLTNTASRNRQGIDDSHVHPLQEKGRVLKCGLAYEVVVVCYHANAGLSMISIWSLPDPLMNLGYAHTSTLRLNWVIHPTKIIHTLSYQTTGDLARSLSSPSVA